MRNIEKYTNALSKAIDKELMRELSFGCVNYWSKGSHNDMDFELFLISKNSIINSLESINWGLINNFSDLRRAGFEVETQMFSATNSINTHKGLIFLHMFLAKAYMDRVTWYELNDYIRILSRPLLMDYEDRPKAILRDVNGLKDVRNYPLTGFEDLTKLVDKIHGKDISDEYLTLYLISKVDDTTTFNRSDLQILRILQSKADDILKIDDEDLYKKEIHKLNNFYKEHYISTGGVADLFTTIRTLEYLREEFDE